MIAHSSSEFVLDFIQLMPGVPKAKVKYRIIITPEHEKKFPPYFSTKIPSQLPCVTTGLY